MRITMIKKFNIIVSLWLVAVIGVLCVFGFQLNSSGCYIAALVFAGMLLISNVINLISGIMNSRIRIQESKKQIQ